MSASFSLSEKLSFANALLKKFCETEIVDSEQCFNIFNEILLWVLAFFELRLFITFFMSENLALLKEKLESLRIFYLKNTRVKFSFYNFFNWI